MKVSYPKQNKGQIFEAKARELLGEHYDTELRIIESKSNREGSYHIRRLLRMIGFHHLNGENNSHSAADAQAQVYLLKKMIDRGKYQAIEVNELFIDNYVIEDFDIDPNDGEWVLDISFYDEITKFPSSEMRVIRLDPLDRVTTQGFLTALGIDKPQDSVGCVLRISERHTVIELGERYYRLKLFEFEPHPDSPA